MTLNELMTKSNAPLSLSVLDTKSITPIEAALPEKSAVNTI
ncbi:hypothetical protein MTYP_03158 [Methylophilaceae bacterium]|nr:hypothetical protein MTYP_03158 [Methylophilaceae bacterium]